MTAETYNAIIWTLILAYAVSTIYMHWAVETHQSLRKTAASGVAGIVLILSIIWLVAHKPPAVHIDFERRCLEMLFEKETNP